jgi:hypothetical protein
VNRELLPFLQQVRQFSNYVGTSQSATTTAGTGTFTTIWTSAEPAVNQLVLIDFTVMGIAPAAGDCAVFKRTGTFLNVVGLLQQGATAAIYTQNSPGYAVQFLVVGNHVEVQVQDDGAQTVNWSVTVGTQEVGP